VDVCREEFLEDFLSMEDAIVNSVTETQPPVYSQSGHKKFRGFINKGKLPPLTKVADSE
jgi:hypothetical protein